MHFQVPSTKISLWLTSRGDDGADLLQESAPEFSVKNRISGKKMPRSISRYFWTTFQMSLSADRVSPTEASTWKQRPQPWLGLASCAFHNLWRYCVPLNRWPIATPIARKQCRTITHCFTAIACMYIDMIVEIAWNSRASVKDEVALECCSLLAAFTMCNFKALHMQ